MLDIGRVTRPHGLKGQVVVELWTDREERLNPGTELSAAGRTLRVVGASRQASSGGKEADLDLRDPQLGPLGRHQEIARQRQLEATRQGEALDLTTAKIAPESCLRCRLDTF